MLCLEQILIENGIILQNSKYTYSSPPSIFGIALKFANWIDPALQFDVHCEKPWFLSPLLCSMNIVNVQNVGCNISPLSNVASSLEEKTTKHDKSHYSSGTFSRIINPAKDSLPPWSNVLTENTNLLSPDPTKQLFCHSSISERKKYYQKPKNRQSTILKPDKIYNFEVQELVLILRCLHPF